MNTLFRGEPAGNSVVYISDIHGDIDSLRMISTLPEYHNPEYEFMFCGDYVDGSIYGFEVLDFVKRECDEGWAKAIIGNHDKMLLDFLRVPDEFNKRQYYMNGGKKTLKHACGDVGHSAERTAAIIRSKYPHLLKWLGELPTAVVDDHKMCVHAGVRWDDYMGTTDFDALWIRDDYFYENGKVARNLSDKVIVTGHTPTAFLVDDETCPIVCLKNGPARYDIDGGEHAYNRALNVLVLGPQGQLEDTYKIGTDINGKKGGTVTYLH